MIFDCLPKHMKGIFCSCIVRYSISCHKPGCVILIAWEPPVHVHSRMDLLPFSMPHGIGMFAFVANPLALSGFFRLPLRHFFTPQDVTYCNIWDMHSCLRLDNVLGGIQILTVPAPMRIIPQNVSCVHACHFLSLPSF